MKYGEELMMVLGEEESSWGLNFWEGGWEKP